MLCQDDTAPSPDGVSSASYTSSRQTIEQVMDAVVDADVDVAIPQLSQPSPLSSVSLEANEAPARSPTGMRYAVVIAECECCTNHLLFAARVNTHRNILLAKENAAIRGQLLVQKTLQEEACERHDKSKKESHHHCSIV